MDRKERGAKRPWEPVGFEQLPKDAQDLSKQNLDNSYAVTDKKIIEGLVAAKYIIKTENWESSGMCAWECE